MNSEHRSCRLQFGRFDVAAFGCFFVYASGTVVLPVALVALASDLGFSLFEGGLLAGGALHLGRTLSMVVAMLACGFAAGARGKRQTLGSAMLLLGIGLALCALAPTYGILFVALLVAGIGEGVVEGLATPFVQDLHPEDSGQYLNFSHSFWSVGVLFTVLLTGALLAQQVSWRLITAGVASLALLPVLLLLLPTKEFHPLAASPDRLPWRHVMGQMTTILKTPRFWLFFAAMFVAGGGEFCLTYWLASFIQMDIAGSAFAGGAGVACFAGGMVLGRMGWGLWISQHRLQPLIMYSALAGTVLSLSLPSVSHLGLLMLMLFLIGVATAPFWPSVQSYSVGRLPGADTTMLFILLSCAGVPGCGFFAWLMGVVGNWGGGLRQAFYLVPICYLTLAVLIGTDGWRVARSREKGA